jgi:hypothetical protein
MFEKRVVEKRAQIDQVRSGGGGGGIRWERWAVHWLTGNATSAHPVVHQLMCTSSTLAQAVQGSRVWLQQLHAAKVA